MYSSNIFRAWFAILSLFYFLFYLIRHRRIYISFESQSTLCDKLEPVFKRESDLNEAKEMRGDRFRARNE